MRRIARILDLRGGEARPVLQSFLVLFFLIGGHTMLETARDALFLTRLPATQLNLVYIAIAGLSFFAAAGSTRLARRFGRRNALVATLCLAAATTTLLHAATPTPRVVTTLYVFSGLVGAVLSPQFWLITAQMFTSAQGRRLFGPIASGGVLGGVAGAGSAALVLSRLPVTSLLLMAAFAFLGTALLLTWLELPREEASAAAGLEALGEEAQAPAAPSLSWRRHPFVWRVALLVGLSSAALLTVDYLFKSTAARAVAPAELGRFFARYYAVMNGLSLVVQLFVAGRVVRRLGVAGATGVMPWLLLGGGFAAFASGGALVPVLALRLIDGGMRHSLHRVATELLYLPMPSAVRDRAKGLIDTVLARSVQAATAGALLLMGMAGVLSAALLAGMVVVLCAAWAIVAFGIRRPYFDLFRQAIARGTLQLGGASGTEIDVNAAEALVEAMASPEPGHVVAALDVLEQRHRTKLIPALILYHDAEVVLLRALEIFQASTREDWIPLAERLLTHPSEPVRVAAVRALAKHDVAAALERAAADASSAVQGYAAYHLALGSAERDLAHEPRLAALLEANGATGDAGRRVLLAAIADSPDPRAGTLVLAIAESKSMQRSEEGITLAARAMEALRDPRHIPFCVARLALRPGREAIRRALVAMGDAAREALEAALDDPATERRVRTHIPWTIAELGTQRAADYLMERLEREPDGFVRYKVLRALGHMVASARGVTVDQAAVERQARRALLEHLRVTALRGAIEKGHPRGAEASPALELLVGLLQNKQDQSLERAFRFLKIAHPQEDIHRVHAAATSSDRRQRSSAGEFLDTLLSGRTQRELRALFRRVVEDGASEESLARSRALLGPLPASRDEALASLIADHDEGVATIASYYALSLGADDLRRSVDRARRERPSLDSLMDRFTVATPPSLGSGR